jgi:hypothetical protein
MLAKYTGPKLYPLPGVVFGKARISLELALIQKFDGSQNPISSRAGIDPNRPFNLAEANVGYGSQSGRPVAAIS